MSVLGKRQSFPQLPPDTNSRHTQPDSSEEKSKRLSEVSEEAEWHDVQQRILLGIELHASKYS
jgi:hypothetical protein